MAGAYKRGHKDNADTPIQVGRIRALVAKLDAVGVPHHVLHRVREHLVIVHIAGIVEELLRNRNDAQEGVEQRTPEPKAKAASLVHERALQLHAAVHAEAQQLPFTLQLNAALQLHAALHERGLPIQAAVHAAVLQLHAVLGLPARA
eukprot:CAMPEP_0176267522 /NCGR_PEP_ID=MMETSP0121_2-20121125/43202_1 /TAXON_ID=160619 /ORGANISM="Kryptoperidinium foliaceum, Strain CCMP 1326" /LENGTH=146 /DNA_ID=CAMNT_0017607587 /DNA_START=111 /DNA_END=549 /DNA_ORIENTATION=-